MNTINSTNKIAKPESELFDPPVWKIGYPDVMTEEEVIEYLRIPHVSKAKNYMNVLGNLIRARHLPCFTVSRKRVFFLEAVREWILSNQGKKEAA